MAVQLFGAVPQEMADAAKMLEALGVASVDVNMGCPVRKVCQVGGGSAMMTELGRTSALVRKMVEAVRIPVTCKMRLGWDDDNLTAPDLARALEDAGVAAIMVHGRTRQQGFDGSVNLAGIRRVVEAVRSIPVIGNGDITSPEAARLMLEATGCAGVSIGRGAFYNPWIFSHTMHYLETGELLPDPDFSERIRVMSRHFDLMVEVFGESLGCTMFRKAGRQGWYAKRFGPVLSRFFNKGIVRVFPPAPITTRFWSSIYIRVARALPSMKMAISLPKYAPRPQALNFRDEETADERCLPGGHAARGDSGSGGAERAVVSFWLVKNENFGGS